jgi:hypothetical protein
MDFIKSTPDNIDELVKKSKSIYRKERQEALDEIKQYNCQKSRDVITRLAIHDKIYGIKRSAFLVAQAMGITKNGKPIRLTKKDIGYKAADFTKLFLRIKRETSMDEFDLNRFKEHFGILNPEMLDVMSYEKGSKLDSWIESTFRGLPKK